MSTVRRATRGPAIFVSLVLLASDFFVASRTYAHPGAELVRDIGPSIFIQNSFPSHFATVGGVAYSSARTLTAGSQLFKTDGTPAGTQLVKQIRPGPSTSSPSGFLTSNGRIFFRGSDFETGGELWLIDGPGAEPGLVKDINPGPSSSFITEVVAVGDLFYFQADDGATGRELWKSDGTAEGTVLVKDINPSISPTGSPLGSSPSDMQQTVRRSFFGPTMERTAPSCGRATARRRGRFSSGTSA